MDSTNGPARQGSGNFGDHLEDRLRETRQPNSAAAAAAPQRENAEPTPNDFERIRALGYENLIPVIPPGVGVAPGSWLHSRVDRPCIKDPRGKAPGVRTPEGWTFLKGWTEQPPANADDLQRWAAMNASVGLRLGDGLFGIDVDTVDFDLASRARAILEDTIPGAHIERIGRAPKFLILVRVPAGLPYKMVEFGRGPDGKPERIEGLSTGKQAVVAGIHPGTLQPYRWQPAMPKRADLVEATASQIDAFFARVATEFPQATSVRTEGQGQCSSQNRRRGEPAMIEAAVARLPNSTKHFSTRESYRDVGYAIKASMHDVDDDRRAFECFAGWSDRWEDPPDGIGNVEGYAESLWRSLKPPFRIGATWLFEKVASVTGESIGSNWFGPLPAQGAEQWPAPTDIFGDGSSGPPAELAGGILPTVLGDAAFDMAERIGVSTAFAGAAVFATASAAVGSKLKIQPRQLDTDWLQPAFLWFGLIEDPGGKKSPIINAAIAPLARLDARTSAHGRRAVDEWQHRKKPKDAPYEPKPAIERYVVDNFTMEALTATLAENPHGLLISDDELTGLITSLDAYKAAKGGDRSALLRLFDGSSRRVDRAGTGLTPVDMWGASVLGGIQPKKIAAMAGNLEEDGLLQRFLPIVGDGLRRPGVDRLVNENAKRTYEAAITSVAELRLMMPKPIRLSEPAYDELKELWARVERLSALPEMSDAWRGHLGKWPGIAARIFLIFHVFDTWPILEGACDDYPIDPDTARRASRFSEFLLAHAMRFYARFVGLGEMGVRARWIAGFLLARCEGEQRVTRRMVEAARHEYRDDPRKTADAMRFLEFVGWVRTDGTIDRHHVATAWTINPQIFVDFQSRAETEKAERFARQERIKIAATERSRIMENFDDS